MNDRLDSMFDGLQRDLATERGPAARLRERPTWARVLLASVVAAGVCLAVGLRAPRVDLGLYPPLRLAVELTIGILAMALAIWIPIRPLHRPGSGPGSRLALAAALALPLLLVFLPQAHALHPASLEGTGDDLARRALGCFGAGVMYGLPLLILVHGLDRRPRPWTRPRLVAALAAGTLGLVALHLHCPLVHPVHLLWGHATIVGFLAALAWLAGRRPGREDVSGP